jgi:hypothetical protein
MAVAEIISSDRTRLTGQLANRLWEGVQHVAATATIALWLAVAAGILAIIALVDRLFAPAID